MPALLDVSGEVKSGSHGQLGDDYVAAQHSSIGAAGQPDIRVRRGTHTRRIAQADSLRGRAEIQQERSVLVGCGTGQRNGPAAGCAVELLDLDAVSIEPQSSVQVAQAAGKVVVTDESVLDFQASLQHGLVESAAGV